MTVQPPNFFILGAAKAGTTSLYRALQQHPQVYLPFDKEPMFFSREDVYRRGWDWYLRTYFHAAEGQPARGEASPHYLYWSEKVAPRMAAQVGEETRFILIFRDPVRRAYSWYWNMVREGLEDRPFATALAAEEEDLQRHWAQLERDGSMRFGYVRGGLYAARLRPFLEYFDRSRFLFLLQEDLQTDFAAALLRVQRFLGLHPQELQPVRGNPASLPRSPLLQRLLTPPRPLKNALQRLSPLLPLVYGLRDRLMQANLQPVAYPPLEADLACQLRARFREDVLALQEIIGRDLSAWLRCDD